ncbi:hypothetical protein [Methylomicrobium sp. Wu6]|uniref:hypothetical protein n=1 Tax=Methylomicrobium sp. Wu6 TaxID=3107928 RepID=UPI002DD64FA8|nr:hypothetical protein [Methylomicrobium sp. Wu6]MEC4749571.1 hypothetical protein [Methylomicrobium sp. Wu6]
MAYDLLMLSPSKMNKIDKEAKPSWSDIKSKLSDFDRVGLPGIVHDLYAASKDNQTFLHARFGLGDDVLKPYKTAISRWICPDVMRSNQTISVAKAKKAITDYKKAVGQPEGLAELAVFYCEEVFVFLGYCGMDDEGYFDAVVRMFEQALKYVMVLPETKRQSFIERLEQVCAQGQNIGWGVGDDMSSLLSEYGIDD